jgi:hypothetical protein
VKRSETHRTHPDNSLTNINTNIPTHRTHCHTESNSTRFVTGITHAPR